MAQEDVEDQRKEQNSSASKYRLWKIRFKLFLTTYLFRIAVALLLTAMIVSAIVRVCIGLRFAPLRVEDSPAADTVMIGVLAVCGSLIAALAVLQCVVFLASPEQRAKVMPYMGFNTQAVVTSRSRLGLN